MAVRKQVVASLPDRTSVPDANWLAKAAAKRGIVIVGVPPLAKLPHARNMALLLAGQVLAQAGPSCRLFAGSGPASTCDASCVLEAAQGITRARGATMASLLARLERMKVLKCADGPSREALRQLL